MTLAILTLSAFFASVISGIVGMAGGIILLAMMTFLLPIAVVVPIHGAVQFMSNISRTIILRQHIERSVFKYYTFGCPLGALAAYFFISHISIGVWGLVFVSMLLFYMAFKPKSMPDIVLSHRGFFVLGVVSAFMGPLIGATGPMLAPFFARRDLAKETIVSTKSACQTLTHLFKFPIFLAVSFPYLDYALEISLMVIAVIFGTRCGTKILTSISAERFHLLLRIAFAATAFRIGYKVFAS